MINSAIEKARKIPRFKALKEKVQNLSERRPVFVVTYDPRLPNIPAIQRKHWRAMVGMDQYMSEVFPEPPLTAFKRPKNIKEYLVRAKLPGLNNRPKRKVNGMSKCNKPCQACSYILEGKEVKVNYKSTWKIIKQVNCNSYNCVYTQHTSGI